uniref:Uncharacterized protein n=1 Tax=Loa loa TaxID=7209 RepID=A0A1I7V5M9_LOALO
MKLRNSLINMLGEFIGLHKTPDFKLNAQSSQAIIEAVAAETRPVHQRSFSTNSIHESNELINMNPSYRRLSEPTCLPSLTPPRRRHIEQRLHVHSR